MNQIRMPAQGQTQGLKSVGRGNASHKAKGNLQHSHQRSTVPRRKRPLPDDLESESRKATKRAKCDSTPKVGSANVSEQSNSITETGRGSGNEENQSLGAASASEGHDMQAQHLPNHSNSSHGMASEIFCETAPSMIASTANAQGLPIEVQPLVSKYEFTPMSILSSSKMEQKIRCVLERIGKFSFADSNAKPGVVILHAKGDAASKMIAIVEIAKKQIGVEKCKWWQYTKLEGQLIEQKVKRSKQGDTIPGGLATHEQEDRVTALQEAKASESGPAGQTEISVASREEGDDEEMADAFETMPSPRIEKNVETMRHEGDRKKMRNTPIMTIYVARVPVPGLKELYGYAGTQSYP